MLRKPIDAIYWIMISTTRGTTLPSTMQRKSAINPIEFPSSRNLPTCQQHKSLPEGLVLFQSCTSIQVGVLVGRLRLLPSIWSKVSSPPPDLWVVKHGLEGINISLNLWMQLRLFFGPPSFDILWLMLYTWALSVDSGNIALAMQPLSPSVWNEIQAHAINASFCQYTIHVRNTMSVVIGEVHDILNVRASLLVLGEPDSSRPSRPGGIEYVATDSVVGTWRWLGDGDASEFSRLWTSLGHTGETARKLGEPDNPCPSRLGRIGCVATETSAVGTPRGRRGAGALNFHLKSWTSVGYTGTLFPKWRCKRSTIILFIGIFRFCGWYQ